MLSGCVEAPPQCADERCPTGEACLKDRCAPVEAPNTTGELGRYTSVAEHPEGGIIIATYDATYRNLVLLRQDEQGVQTRRVVDGWKVVEHTLQDRDRGKWTSLCLSQEGDAHLAWFDADAGSLRYTRFVDADLDASVDIEVVDGAGVEIRGTHASLALSDDGVVHVAYRDETSKSLRYAERSLSGQWSSEEITSCAGEALCPMEGEDYGEYADLVLVGGQPRLVFYDRLRGDLKLAQPDSAGLWSVVTLDGRDVERDMDTGDVGRFASAAVDAKQRLGVAYYDLTHGALRYIFASGATPLPLVVDDGVYTDVRSGAKRQHIVGQHAKLVFDLRDSAVIFYLDAGQLGLKRARLVGDQVVEKNLLEGRRPGAYIDAVLRASGEIYGAYGLWPADNPGAVELGFLHELGGIQ